MRFAILFTCLLLALCLLLSPPTSRSVSSSRGLMLAEAGALEELMAESANLAKMVRDFEEKDAARTKKKGKTGKQSKEAKSKSAAPARARVPSNECSSWKCPHPDHVASPKKGHVPTSNGKLENFSFAELLTKL
jgi:hypothetical protein